MKRKQFFIVSLVIVWIASGLPAAAQTITITFDAGTGFPVVYSESGMTVRSLFPSGAHLHLLEGPFLLNHGGCCSEPYEFDFGGEPFTPLSFEIFGAFGAFGTHIFTSSQGASFAVTSPGTVNFPAAGWTGITSFRWSVPSTFDSAAMDNLVLSLGIEVPLDIKPGSCPNPFNIKSKGVLPAAVLGTEEFDVSDIDLASLELVGVSPLRISREDVGTPVEPFTGKAGCDVCSDEGADGFDDLVLKFDRQELLAAIEAEMGRALEDGECLFLTLGGRLVDGTGIRGEDVVVVLKKGR